MTWFGRHMTFRAQPGRGDELAAHLLGVAERMVDTPGCGLYLIERDPADADVVVVTEAWRDRAAADKALEAADPAEVERVRGLMAAAPEMRETTILGGTGLGNAESAPQEPGWTRVAIDDVDDIAPAHGFGEVGEARFIRVPLKTRATGLAHHRVKPGRRQLFGHRHEVAEEVYVVLSGSGRVKLEDEVVEVRARDAVRVAPHVARAFEADDEGLEVLAVGPRHAGDGEILRDWWT